MQMDACAGRRLASRWQVLQATGCRHAWQPPVAPHAIAGALTPCPPHHCLWVCGQASYGATLRAQQACSAALVAFGAMCTQHARMARHAGDPQTHTPMWEEITLPGCSGAGLQLRRCAWHVLQRVLRRGRGAWWGSREHWMDACPHGLMVQQSPLKPGSSNLNRNLAITTCLIEVHSACRVKSWGPSSCCAPTGAAKRGHAAR